MLSPQENGAQVIHLKPALDKLSLNKTLEIAASGLADP